MINARPFSDSICVKKGWEAEVPAEQMLTRMAARQEPCPPKPQVRSSLAANRLARLAIYQRGP